jgi:hypothetical protein
MQLFKVIVGRADFLDTSGYLDPGVKEEERQRVQMPHHSTTHDHQIFYHNTDLNSYHCLTT